MSEPHGDRLAISVTTPDGVVNRWGPDEVDGEDVPNDLQLGTAVPGGYTTCSCSLFRDLRPRTDEGLFDDVLVYGAGRRKAWNGRMAQLPRTNTQLKPAAVGYSSHLMDDPSFIEEYVCHDLGRWGSPSAQRRLNLIGFALSPHDMSIVGDDATGGPVIATEFSGPWTTFGKPIVEATFLSRVPVDAAYYEWTKGGNISLPDPNFSWSVALADNDLFLVTDSSGNLSGAGPGSGIVVATTATRKAVVFQISYNGAGGDSRIYGVYWKHPAIYGRHGLTRIPIAGGSPGIRGTDAVADIVARTAPQLNFTTGPDGSIVTGDFVFSHLSYPDPVTGSDAIALINGSFLWEWGVYDDKVFFFRPPAQTNVWEARLGSAAKLSLEGDQAEDLVNGVIVAFSDATGRKMAVGPPGWTGGDATDARLVDTDPSNPVNEAGIPKKWKRLDLSVVTNTTGAIQIGAVFLAQQQLARRRGTIQLIGNQTLRGQAGDQPAWAPKAGDWVTVVDRPHEPLRRMISTGYTHRDRTLNADLDNTSQKLDAILERLGVGQIGNI